MKYNIGGAAHGALGLAACGDLFHGRAAVIVGCFTNYLGLQLVNYANFLVLSEVLELQLRKDGIVYELKETLRW